MKFRAIGLSLVGLTLALGAGAAEPPAAAPAPEATAAATSGGASEAPAAAPAAAPSHRVVLGPMGRDASGREGRIHTVARGDTLWDISDAYLGTPWVWPSLWNDNQGEIANPHRIRPGDKVWVSPWEMRPVSDQEARDLLAAAGGAPPAAIEDADARPGRTVRFSLAEVAGFLSEEDVKGSGSVVALPDGKTMTVYDDLVDVDAGAASLRKGDQLSFFRSRVPVVDPDTGRRVGVEVEVLGWGEVQDVGAESARVRIRSAHAEIERGDRFVRREMASTTIAVRETPPGIEGKLLHFPDLRTQMGSEDVVYLDRGQTSGLAVGNELEIYRPGGVAESENYRDGVALQDDVIGRVLLVGVQQASAVGVVVRTSTDLVKGDRVRTPRP